MKSKTAPFTRNIEYPTRNCPLKLLHAHTTDQETKQMVVLHNVPPTTLNFLPYLLMLHETCFLFIEKLFYAFFIKIYSKSKQLFQLKLSWKKGKEKITFVKALRMALLFTLRCLSFPIVKGLGHPAEFKTVSLS